jgi:Skp family chaperone for outer membrane proteins
MKRIIILLIILVGLGYLAAQSVKLAYVNTDRILAGSNEAAEIARIYDLDRQNWVTQIRTLNEEIKSMERTFEIEKLTKNEAAKRDAQTKIDTKKKQASDLLDEYFGDNGKAELRYKELIEPLTKKISDEITKYAQDGKYTMVLDVSMGTVLYADDSLDITERILAVLNKDNPKPAAETDKPGENVKPGDPTKPPVNPPANINPNPNPYKPGDVKPPKK